MKHIEANELKVRAVATALARNAAIRINPDLFNQYLFSRLAAARLCNVNRGRVRFKQIRGWVLEYDRSFNRPADEAHYEEMYAEAI